MDAPHPDTARVPDGAGPDDAVLVISVAAELAGMHAQTLRTYDRLGLVSPRRTDGGGRRYSLRDVERLREVQRLSQDEGVNLAGVKKVIELSGRVEALEQRIRELLTEATRPEGRTAPRRPGGELVHVPRSTSVVVWRSRREREKRD